jgi:hypothetical protein
MVFALADVGSFLALFCRAAALLVEFDDLREETTLDGRVVSVGASRPGTSDGCVVHTSRTILPNCLTGASRLSGCGEAIGGDNRLSSFVRRTR